MNKKRRHWNDKTSLGENSAIEALAKYALHAPFHEKEKTSVRLDLCDRSRGFNVAFNAELEKENNLVDLTDDERAFCSGWAFLASVASQIPCEGQEITPEIQDLRIKEFIAAQLQGGAPGDVRTDIISG